MPFRCKERRRAYHREYYRRRPKKELTPEQRERKRISQRKYDRKRCQNLDWKLKNRLRVRLYGVLKNQGVVKSSRTLDLLGCSHEHFRKHIEERFDENMSWENYGTYWHIDHIRPCASFDLHDENQQRQCFHYTNLQPLEAKANMSKGAKWP